MRGAIHNDGPTDTEIREAVLQATVYRGTRAGVEAMQVTKKTLDVMVGRDEHKRPGAAGHGPARMQPCSWLRWRPASSQVDGTCPQVTARWGPEIENAPVSGR